MMQSRLILIFILYFFLIEAGKLRTWRGPVEFFDGSAPSSRYSMGICVAGGNLYVFGGSGNGGELFLGIFPADS